MHIPKYYRMIITLCCEIFPKIYPSQSSQTPSCAYNVWAMFKYLRESTPTMIRKATPDDTSTLEEIITSFVERGDVLPRTLTELNSLIDTCFVAEIDGEIVGTAILEVYSWKLAEIRSLCVLPSAQGKGFGHALIEACVELARERGILEVMAITRAEGVFMKSGFDYTLPNLRRAVFLNIHERDNQEVNSQDENNA